MSHGLENLSDEKRFEFIPQRKENNSFSVFLVIHHVNYVFV